MVQLFIEMAGVAWKLYIIGFMPFATGVPAALLIKEQGSNYSEPSVDSSAFKSLPYYYLLLVGVIGIFRHILSHLWV